MFGCQIGSGTERGTDAREGKDAKERSKLEQDRAIVSALSRKCCILCNAMCRREFVRGRAMAQEKRCLRIKGVSKILKTNSIRWCTYLSSKMYVE